ncbi:Ceramidase [seawater metagenome]|uniref:Ceramidase n=1 Tax=seawater metagenome TaxID=1561972 RepID=A0A5E8CKR8_9ZZZZ
MKFKKDFWLSTPRFCEHYFWESGNEYLNTISSLAITFFGLYGLLQYSTFFMVNLLYGFLFSNGIFSALNHWHGIDGWAYADALTMILPVSLGLILIFDMYNQFHSIIGISKIISFILYPLLIYVPIILHKYTDIFSYLFLVLALSLLSFIPVVLSIKNNVSPINAAIATSAMYRFLKGTFLVILGAGLWFSTEPKCHCPKTDPEKKKRLGKLCFHVMWHIFAGWGFYLMISAFDIVQKII